ncbi:hypothetical protein [Peptoniphilus catoniae]|uniref:hypothetical protein n=1 Tax=Peptoniphilus catoniae TaxID=1660341 RepID=UPI0010FE4433|nr:hypothetical protein [Peptoniphilus catoniae]
MSLFDDLTDNLKDLKSNIDVITKKIKENSQEIKNQTSLKLEIASEKRKLSKTYQELGSKLYENYKEGKIADYNDYVSEIDKMLSRIEGLNLKLRNQSYNREFNKEETLDNNQDIIYINEEDLNK